MRAVRESEGGAALLEGFLEDITLRKQAEVALQESEARFRMLFESARDAIFLMQGERFISCNPATLAMFGAPEQEILGKTPAHFSPPVQPDGRSSQEKASEKLRAALS